MSIRDPLGENERLAKEETSEGERYDDGDRTGLDQNGARTETTGRRWLPVREVQTVRGALDCSVLWSGLVWMGTTPS